MIDDDCANCRERIENDEPAVPLIPRPMGSGELEIVSVFPFLFRGAIVVVILTLPLLPPSSRLPSLFRQ